MKNHKLPILTAILGIAILLFAGCQSLDKALYDETLVSHPAITNIVVVPPSTNTVTGQVTPASTNEIITPARQEKLLTEKPSVTATLDTAKDIPIPYAGMIASLLAAIYSGYKFVRNKQALKAVVLGVDAGRIILQSTPEGQKLDAKFKDQLIKHQEIGGVLKLVSDVVNTYTDDTVKTDPS